MNRYNMMSALLAAGLVGAGIVTRDEGEILIVGDSYDERERVRAALDRERPAAAELAPAYRSQSQNELERIKQAALRRARRATRQALGIAPSPAKNSTDDRSHEVASAVSEQDEPQAKPLKASDHG